MSCNVSDIAQQRARAANARTVAQARQTQCRIAFLVRPGEHVIAWNFPLCAGPECALWRWHRLVESADDSQNSTGYCGIGGPP